MQVEIQPNYLFVTVPYGYNEVAKDIGAIEFSGSKKMWKFPNNIYMLRDLLRHFPILKHNMELVDYGKMLRAKMDRLLEIKKLEDTPGDPRLRPYQRVDVEYLKEVESAGVFNEQRTGKTPTMIVTMKELGTRRNLVVAPASLGLNWEREFGIWGAGIKVFRVTGTPKKRQEIYDHYHKCVQSGTPSVIIVSKDTLKGADLKWFKARHFDTVVVDEGHFLRKHHTAQSEAIHALDARRRYVLTGTPTVKNGTDIYGILSWLFPGQYTSYWAFVRRYFEVYQDNYGGTMIGSYNPQREKELQELIGFSSVQRKRKDVMAWLPPKTFIPIKVEMDKKQKKLYDQMELTFTAIDEETGDMVDTPTVLAQLTRLRQLCLDPALLGFDAPSAKTDAIMEWLEDNPGQPVVIMSMFTSYLNRLKGIMQQKGISVGLLTGEMSNEAKGTAAQDFQTGKYQVLLCNIISAGVGFTLDRADTIIFTDKAWNPSDQRQAEDRIIPIDQSRLHPVNVVTFPIADTVDEKIEGILNYKENLTEVINTGSRDAILALMKR